MNSPIGISPCLIVCLGLLLGLTADGQGQEAGKSDLAALRTVLFETTGQAYLEARQEALELSDEQFARLLSPWRKGARDSVPRLLADILMVRRSEPVGAKAFDAMLADGIANPEIRHRSGRPQYQFPISELPFELDPLVFEAVLKLKLSLPVQRVLTGSRHHANPANIDRHLALLRADVSESVKGAAVRALGRIAQKHPDNRIIAPLVQRYQQRRQDASQLYKPFASTGFMERVALKRLGTPEALEALEELIIFEQIQMPVQGLQPWNDPDPGGQRTDLDVQKAALNRQLLAERKTLTARQTDQIRQQISDLDEQIAEANKRFQAKMLWDGLHRLRDQLKDKLEQKQLDELLKQPENPGDLDSS